MDCSSLLSFPTVNHCITFIPTDTKRRLLIPEPIWAMNKMRPFRVIGEREDNETDLPPKQKKESEKKISAPIFGTVVYRLQSVFFAFQHLKEEEEKKKEEKTTFAYQKLYDHNRHVIWLDMSVSILYIPDSVCLHCRQAPFVLTQQ